MATVSQLRKALPRAKAAGDTAAVNSILRQLRNMNASASEKEIFPVELAEGVASGIIGIGQGFGELGASAVDLVAGTDYASAVTNSAEELRDNLGIDPEGFIGKGAEVLTQFVVPGVAAARAVGGISKVGRSIGQAKGAKDALTSAERFGFIAKDLGAAAAVDAAVSTDGMTTIGDFFGGGFTATDDTIGLDGRAEALRRIKNKLKIGAEAGVAGAAVTGAFAGAKAASKGIKASQLGQDAASGLTELERKRVFSPDELSTGQQFFADLMAGFRYRSFLPEQIATRRLGITGAVQNDIKKAEMNLNSLERDLNKALGGMSKEQLGSERMRYMNILNDFVTEADETKRAGHLKQLPNNELKNTAKRMRNHVDDLSKYILKESNFIRYAGDLNAGEKQLAGKTVKEVIESNIGSYLRRRYKIFEDARYTPDEGTIKAAESFLKSTNRTGTGGGKNFVESELTRELRVNPANIDRYKKELGIADNEIVGAGNTIKVKLTGNVNDATAKFVRESIFKRYKGISNRKHRGGTVATERLKTGMFLERAELPTNIKRLLGEIDDPREAYLGTVADLAQFKATDDYFGMIEQMAANNASIGKYFFKEDKVNPATGKTFTEYEIKDMLDSGDYVRLGSTDAPSILKTGEDIQLTSAGKQSIAESELRSGWGSINGYIVPRKIYDNMTSTVLAETSPFAQAAKKIMGGLLRAKGISQYSKTILSPITQIRNFTTASLFALANGNVGAGMKGDLASSADMVFQNLRGLSKDPASQEKFLEELEGMQRRGVLGTNTELKEIQDMINKGVGFSDRDPKSGAAALFSGSRFTEGLADTKLARGGGKALKKFEELYQGSDDFWKIYYYEFETRKLHNALRGLTDEQKFMHLTKQGQDQVIASDTYQNLVKSGGKIENGKVTFGPDNFVKNVDGTSTTQLLRTKQGILDELIKDKAAQIVRDTVPNYNRAPGFIKAVRKQPFFGNFVTFPFEIYRTGTNIISQALEEINSGIPALKQQGIQRMTGFLTTTTVLPGALASLAYATTGVDRDEMKAFQRSFGAPWEKNALLIPLGKDEDGKISYINFSTSNPYDTLSRMGYAALNAIETGDALDKSVPDIMGSVMTESIFEFAKPFADQSMVAEALLDVTARNGRQTQGGEVYNEQDTTVVQLQKSMLHVMETILPNIVPLQVSGGELGISRGARGILGEFGVVNPKDKMGNERTGLGELSRLTGFSSQTFDPKRGLKYAARRFQRGQSDANRLFTKYTDDENATPNTFLKGYQYANQQKLANDKQYYRMIEDLRSMGVPNAEIGRILKANGISGWKDIIKGKYKPVSISPQSIRKMKVAGTYSTFPTQQINSLRQSMSRIDLSTEYEPEESIVFDKVLNPLGAVKDALSNIVPAAEAGTMPTSQMPQFTQPQFTTSPASLAGSNPATQEIANRLTRQ